MQDSRLSYLKTIGIDVWVRRSLGERDEAHSSLLEEVPAGLHVDSEPAQIPSHAPASVVAAASDVRPQATMIPDHALEEVPLVDAPEPFEVDTGLPTNSGVAELDWPDLQQWVASCTLCELHQSRTQTVFGVGDTQADILIIGEAPGADEDRQGEPFVGKAGQLLNAMLAAINLSREQVYIANILKCRPPNNRDPKPEEAELCSAYLYRQIQLIQPKLILALGRIAAQRLLQSSSPLGRMRNQIHRLPSTDTPLIVTYHPAYLLRSPAEKRKAWEDLCSARNFVANAKEQIA